MKGNKKHKVIEELYKNCKNNNNFIFHNDAIKEICKRVGFGNPFDVTKIDNRDKLPQILKNNDMAIVHLDSGRHQFVQGIDYFYHSFETIETVIDWHYKKSILNQFNSSESNILSVANNQRILHDFLFDADPDLTRHDIAKRSKTYFPHRTKTSFEYSVKNTKLSLKNIQIEIDLTIEFSGTVCIIEGKNGKADNFAVYQLYHPFLYYYNANKEKLNNQVKNIYGVYLLREQIDNLDILSLWCYTFDNPLDITTIKLIKSASYKLIPSNEDSNG